MQKYTDIILSPLGTPIGGAVVSVTNYPSNTPATIYATDGGSAVDSVMSDPTGRFSFYAADGHYNLSISGTGITPQVVNDIVLNDPSNDATLAALAASGGSALVGFQQAGTGAVARTVQAKLQDRKSIFDFMAASLQSVVTGGSAYTAQNRADMLTAVTNAWNAAFSAGIDLYFPAGRYELGDYSFPWRQSGAVSSLLDCKNISIVGDGQATVFATVSSGGADVFQLNGVKNLHFRDLLITASISATTGSGSNAVSVTGGYDNITFDNVVADNCQSIDKTDHIDGGKALTIQCDAATQEVGTLKANILARKCSQGLGIEAGLTNFLTKKVAIEVDLIAEDCYVAVSIGGSAATGAIPAGTHTGVRVSGLAINCQKDVMLARAHGIQVEIQTITTKTPAARRLDPRGVAWYAADQIVEALLCTYAKNSQIRVVGNKGSCDYKARIGGATAGSSGLTGATENCEIFMDINGTAATGDVVAVNSGGNTTTNSRLIMTPTTATAPDTAFYTLANANTVVIGASHRLISTKLAGHTGFAPGTDGTFEYAALDLFAGVPGLQGKGSSSTNTLVLGLYDQAGNMGLGIKNPGRPWLPSAIPTYADNASALAGGFVAGDVYRTSTGTLMVVY